MLQGDPPAGDAGDEKSAEEELHGHIEEESKHLEKLNKATDELQQQLEDAKADMLRLKGTLESGDDPIVVGEESISREEARKALAARFDRYRSQDAAANQLTTFRKVRSARLDKQREQWKELTEDDQATAIAAIRCWQEKLKQMNAIEETLIRGEQPDPVKVKLLQLLIQSSP